MKKILIIGSIHNHGIDLLKENKNFEFEVVDNTDAEFLKNKITDFDAASVRTCLLYTSPSPRDLSTSRMPSSA